MDSAGTDGSNGMRLATWTRGMQRSMLREMISVVSRPGILSFAGGLPAPELFPAEAYASALAHVLSSDPLALQYRPPYTPLLEQTRDLMARRGVCCSTGEIFLTTGAQQGLDLLARLLLDRGRQILVEETFYTGLRQAVAPMQPEYLTVPTDLESGMEVEAVEAHLRRGARPAFIYVVPDGHNPLGVSLSYEKRVRLVELARHYRTPIIEDDPYGLLCYTRESLPPLRAMDEEWVFYVGSFSKILAPAVRLGWIVAPSALISSLTVVKEASDLESSALTQRAVATFLGAGRLPEHLATICEAYRTRRDTMLRALERAFPSGARWSRPTSGMFIWIELEPRCDTTALLRRAVEEAQVAYIPGEAFAAGRAGRASHCLRLSYSNAPPEQIATGIAHLARLFHTVASSPPPDNPSTLPRMEQPVHRERRVTDGRLSTHQTR